MFPDRYVKKQIEAVRLHEFLSRPTRPSRLGTIFGGIGGESTVEAMGFYSYNVGPPATTAFSWCK